MGIRSGKGKVNWAFGSKKEKQEKKKWKGAGGTWQHKGEESKDGCKEIQKI